MSKILVIDHSVIAYKSYNRLYTPDFRGQTDNVQAEFTNSYLSDIMYLYELHQPDTTYFLIDCPRGEVWRHVTVNEFYLARTKMYIEIKTLSDGTVIPITGHWIFNVDGKWRKAWYNEEGSTCSANLAKKDVDVTKLQLVPDVTIKASGSHAMNLFWEVIPGYKGNRDDTQWKGALPKDEWKKLALELAGKVTSHVNGTMLRAETAEADDLAYLIFMKHAKDEVIYCTTDRDWIQLARNGHKVFDVSTRNYMDSSPATLNHIMALKIMLGDKSDNIKGIRKIGAKALIGPKKAESEIKDAGSYGALFKTLAKECDESYARNLKLICLNQTPIKTSDVTASRSSVKNELPITATSLNMAKTDAQKDRVKLRMQASKPQEVQL